MVLLSLPSSLPLLVHLLNLRVHLLNLRHKKLPVVRLSLPSDFPLLVLLLSLRHKTLPVVLLSLPTSPRCRSTAKCSHKMQQTPCDGHAKVCINKCVLS